MALRIRKIRQVCDATGLSQAEIYRRVARNAFPAPVKLGGARARASGWLEHEIEQWIKDRIRESRGGDVDRRSTSDSN